MARRRGNEVRMGGRTPADCGHGAVECGSAMAGLLGGHGGSTFGNAGTGARLTMGLVGTYDMKTSFMGESFRSPCGRWAAFWCRCARWARRGAAIGHPATACR